MNSGLLAYLDGKVVGWCNVAPRVSYLNPRYLKQAIVNPDERVGSITCFVVSSRQRLAAGECGRPPSSCPAAWDSAGRFVFAEQIGFVYAPECVLPEEQEVAHDGEVDQNRYVHDGAVDANRMQQEELHKDEIRDDGDPDEAPAKENLHGTPRDAVRTEGYQVDHAEVDGEIEQREDFQWYPEHLAVRAAQYLAAVEVYPEIAPSGAERKLLVERVEDYEGHA